MRALGAILIILGFLISLSGLGAILGVPMIVIGVVALIEPRFMYIGLLSGVIAYEMSAKNASQFLTIFVSVCVAILVIHLAIEHWDLINGRQTKKSATQPNEEDNNRFYKQNGQYSDNKECPFCKEIIKLKAIKCKHCGSDLQETDGKPTKDIVDNHKNSLVNTESNYKIHANINDVNNHDIIRNSVDRKNLTHGKPVKKLKDAINLLELLGWTVKKKLDDKYELIRGPHTHYCNDTLTLINKANHEAEKIEGMSLDNKSQVLDSNSKIHENMLAENNADALALLDYMGWIIKENDFGWEITKNYKTLYVLKDTVDLVNIANNEYDLNNKTE